MKKLISYALAIAILAAVPGIALAGNKGDKPLAGKVTAVDANANTITIKQHKTDTEQTFKTAGAAITVDGVSGKLADITVGMHAKITVGATPDTATAIDAMTHRKGGKNSQPTPAAAASPTATSAK